MVLVLVDNGMPNNNLVDPAVLTLLSAADHVFKIRLINSRWWSFTRFEEAYKMTIVWARIVVLALSHNNIIWYKFKKDPIPFPLRQPYMDQAHM